MKWNTVRPSWPPFEIWRMWVEARRNYWVRVPLAPFQWDLPTPGAAALIAEYRVGLAVLRPTNLVSLGGVS
jgi:hypothetical protein